MTNSESRVRILRLGLAAIILLLMGYFVSLIKALATYFGALILLVVIVTLFKYFSKLKPDDVTEKAVENDFSCKTDDKGDADFEQY